MTSRTIATKTTDKKVIALARYTIKATGYIVYQVLSSNGKDKYCTMLTPEGKATGCTCPATVTCWHMRGCEAKEAERTAMNDRLAVIGLPVAPTTGQTVKMATPVQAAVSDLALSAKRAKLSESEHRSTAPLSSNRPFSLLK